jgi:DNA-binding LytR/AlgR family response regulator
MDFETYNARRRRYEIGFWLVFFIVNVGANAIVSTMNFAHRGAGVAAWEPWVWEISSGLVWLALLPVLLAFDARFPLARRTWRRNLPAHVAFTLPYSGAHVAGMVGLRHLAYRLAGAQYDFGDWPVRFFYEFLKDFRTYFTFIALIYLYRLWLRRWQGEASLPDRAEADPAPADRFLVRKLGKEFLVRVVDIDWLEAAGNYVNLHANGRVYPLRETMAAMEARLGAQGFLRVHRSVIVNMDRVAEIEPFDTGDARARLTSGEIVPVSRRYRTELRERLG